jgi:hypothetical protein
LFVIEERVDDFADWRATIPIQFVRPRPEPGAAQQVLDLTIGSPGH